MYTHWACFDCRKSFAKDASTSPRKCPDCAGAMTDMGPYFEPPRKAAVKRWRVMRVLSDEGFRFNTREAKDLIERRILMIRNPRREDVLERIEEVRRRGRGVDG